MAQLVRVPARRAGDLDSNPGPGENFSLKLLKSELLGYAFVGGLRSIPWLAAGEQSILYGCIQDNTIESNLLANLCAVANDYVRVVLVMESIMQVDIAALEVME